MAREKERKRERERERDRENDRRACDLRVTAVRSRPDGRGQTLRPPQKSKNRDRDHIIQPIFAIQDDMIHLPHPTLPKRKAAAGNMDLSLSRFRHLLVPAGWASVAPPRLRRARHGRCV